MTRRARMCSSDADPANRGGAVSSSRHGQVVSGPPAGSEIVLRAMTPADVERGLRLCRASGWNQIARDWQYFLTVNPDGARVLQKHEQVVGTVTSLRYGPFGWLAMVLVDPAERGRGFGTRLLGAGLDLLSDLPSTRLDATPAGEGLYRARGFEQEGRLLRMARLPDPLPPCSSFATARPMEPRDLSAVADWDRAAFGGDRRVLLDWLHRGAPEYAWVVEVSGRLTGYAFGREGFTHHHLGPVVAEDTRTALHAVRTCLASHPGRSFFVDADDRAPAWIEGLRAMGFVAQRSFLRMALGAGRFGMPSLRFASAGPELG